MSRERNASWLSVMHDGGGHTGREHVQGWVLSLALHGSLVGLVLLRWGEVRPPLVNEPFVWEVSLVGAPFVETSASRETTAKVGESHHHPESIGAAMAPTLTQPRAPVEQAVERRSLETQPLEARAVAPKPEPTGSPSTDAEMGSPQPVEHSEGEPVVEQAAAPPAAIQARHGGAGPDYDWLKKLLWHSLERAKSYPDHALANGWEGRVVLEITIAETGRIVEVVVAESSGHVALDRGAKALAQDVSRLSLPRTLGAPRVRLRVPMRFGLE